MNKFIREEIKMKKYSPKSVTLVTALLLAGCNGGGSNTKADSPTYSGVVKVHNGGVYAAGASLSQRPRYSNKVTTLDSINSEPSTPIGWNSTLNTMAPASCWEYTAILTNPNGDTSLGSSMSSSQFEQSLGVDASISGTFDIFSASNSTSYSSMKSTDQLSVSAFNSAITTYLLRASVSGLNDYGRNILNTQPMAFKSICGDSVIATIPLKMQAGINLVFTSNSVKDSSSFANKVAFGAGFADLAVGIKNDKSDSSSNVSVTFNEFIFGDSALYPPLSDKGSSSLTNCMSNGSTPDCNAFLIEFNSGYSQAVDAGHKSFVAQNGTNWGSIYANDFSKFRNGFQAYSINNFLTPDEATQLANAKNNNFWQPYLSSVKRNIDVMADIDLVNAVFKQIKEYNPTLKNPEPLTTLLDYETVISDYSLALTTAQGTLKNQLGQCLYAKDQASADNSCSQLDPKIDVFSLIASSLHPLTKSWYPAELQGLLTTVRLMIYDVLYKSTLVASMGEENITPSYTNLTPQKFLVLPISINVPESIPSATKLNNWALINAKYSDNGVGNGINNLLIRSTPVFTSPNTVSGNTDRSLLTTFPKWESTISGINIRFDGLQNTLGGSDTSIYKYYQLTNDSINADPSSVEYPTEFTYGANYEFSHVSGAIDSMPIPCFLYGSDSQGCLFKLSNTFEETGYYYNPDHDGYANYYVGKTYQSSFEIKDNSARRLFKTIYPYE